MTTISTVPPTSTRPHLWTGAGLTAAAALFFPRVSAVLHDGEKIWQLDREARVLAPIVVALALLVFAAVGPWAWRGGSHNRPARVGLVVSLVAVLGLAAYWMSAPIVFGGLAVTLGLEGIRREDDGRRGEARAAVVVGSLALLSGAALWLLNV